LRRSELGALCEEKSAFTGPCRGVEHLRRLQAIAQLRARPSDHRAVAASRVRIRGIMTDIRLLFVA
jgi:hypothetical protein